ncbi:hypothetical protein Tco_0193790 [Tanacetum coccineum]
MEGKKPKDSKNKSFDSIQKMFDKAFKRVNTFVDFKTDLVEGSSKRAGTELEQEVTKKQKVDDVQETAEVDNDQEAAKIKELVEIDLDKEEVAIDVIPLAVKPSSIIDWKLKEFDLLKWDPTREDDHDVIHDNNSSDLLPFTSLNDLNFATLNTDGQSTYVEAPLYIIDVDKDDDFIDNEDSVPHDLAHFDDEVLANDDDDDDDDVMSATVARGHGDDCGDDDPSRPPPRLIGTDCRGVGGRNTTKRGREGGRQGTRELCYHTLSPHHTHRTVRNYSSTTLIYPSHDRASVPTPHGTGGRQGPAKDEKQEHWMVAFAQRKLWLSVWRLIEDLIWPKIKKGIDQHMAKVYVDNKSALKAKHWSVRPDGTRDVAAIRSRPPANVKQAEWDMQIDYWLDPRCPSRSKCSKSGKEQGLLLTGISLAGVLRDQQEEMLRLKDLGANTPTGVPYIEDQIMAMMLSQLDSQHEIGGGSGSGSGGGGDDEPHGDEDAGGDEEI